LNSVTVRRSYYQTPSYAAIAAKRNRAINKYQSESKQLAAADAAARRGDMDEAIAIYNRLAVSRSKTQVSAAALHRLNILPKLALDRMKEIDAALPGDHVVTTTNDVLRAASGDARAIEWRSTVIAAFEDYDHLIDQCMQLRGAIGDIRRHVADQENRVKYTLVLKEEEAAELLKVGREQETNGELCCAYLAYEKAAQFLPAPSAQLARDRFARMQKDSEVVAAAKTCTELQWCHKTYRTAEHLAAVKPDRAKELFAQILDKAPTDSEVFRAARQRIYELRRAG
jgi:tetratricopeptide (TPR) repeat protein